MRRTTAVVGAALAALTLVGLGSAASASNQGPGPGAPWTTTIGHVVPNHGATTIPYFQSSFTYQGTTYPYWMVGTDPQTSAATTQVPDEIVPIRLVFASGGTLDATPDASSTLSSPLYTPASFNTGNTQYGDAIQRAEFWQYVAGDAYHVLLAQPAVLPTVTLSVPSGQGFLAPTGYQIRPGRTTGRPVGLLNYQWFTGQYSQIINSLHLPATSLPILLTHDTFLYQKAVSACCVGGFHSVTSAVNGNGNQQVQTAIWSDYGDYNQLTDRPTFAWDINALSHEVSEWMNDPFVSNVVPPWSSPLAPQYGCSNLLEVGDPLVGVEFTVNGYHPQDEAFLSWFARQQPSIGYHGLYTYLGTFASPAPTC